MGVVKEEWNKLKTKQKSSGKTVEKSLGSGTIKSSSTKEDIQVYSVGKINRDIYRCITEDIVTDEVIITDERIRHIEQRHPGDYVRFGKYIPEIMSEPDYIIRDERPNTAVVLKMILDNDTGEYFRLALRLVTFSDDSTYKNSVITFMHIRKREYERVVRNKEVLYRKE